MHAPGKWADTYYRNVYILRFYAEKKRDKSNDDGSGGNDCDDASDSNGKKWTLKSFVHCESDVGGNEKKLTSQFD